MSASRLGLLLRVLGTQDVMTTAPQSLDPTEPGIDPAEQQPAARPGHEPDTQTEDHPDPLPDAAPAPPS